MAAVRYVTAAVSTTAVRRLTLASLVANVVIVVTGGAVRLTGSGLGCPTWPRCTDDSYVTTAEMGVHGVIEYGNRMLGIIVGVVAVATVAAIAVSRDLGPRRGALLRPALWMLGLVVLQGLIGGLSVRVHLDPWVVAAHFLLSMVLLAIGYALWRRAARRAPVTVPAPLPALARLLAAVSFAVLAIGTVVTGSGPHSGDPQAGRTGLDPGTVSQLHADAVFLLIGLSVALWFALRAVGAARPAVRAAAVLILVELAQGVVGFVQYAAGLPVLAVGLHMLGSCLVWLATLAVLWSLAPGKRSTKADPDRAAAGQSVDAAGSTPDGQVAGSQVLVG